jgi:uncharacterized protein YjbI with pentapeptide repeats
MSNLNSISKSILVHKLTKIVKYNTPDIVPDTIEQKIIKILNKTDNPVITLIQNINLEDLDKNELEDNYKIKNYLYNSGSDIFLKGTKLLLGINKCGLIGTQNKLPIELESFTNNKNIGLIFSNDCLNKNIKYNDCFTPEYNSEKSSLNFNCIKIIYDNINNQNNIVTNINLYNTDDLFPNKTPPLNILPVSLPPNYESLIPWSNYEKNTQNILSVESNSISSELTHTISYSFMKSSNKVSINVKLTNTTTNKLTNLKYNYALNLNNQNLKTSPNVSGIFCNLDKITQNGLYLRTDENNSNIFIDDNWNWLYDDLWNEIKLPKSIIINENLCAISGLIFNKSELNVGESWSINFCLGFTHEHNFISGNITKDVSGLDFTNINLSNQVLCDIITSYADFTGCDLSDAILDNNSLIGSKTGPLAPNSTCPKLLPDGYKFIVSNNKFKNKYIVGPYVNLSYCDLSDCDFTEISLFNCNLIGCNLLGVNLNTDINNIKLSHINNLINEYKPIIIPNNYCMKNNLILGLNIDYTNTDFTNCDLSNINLSGCNFTNCNFNQTNLSNTNLSECILTNAIISNIIKTDNTILPFNYKFVLLNNNNYVVGPNINLSNLDLTDCNLKNCNLSGVNFTNCKMFNTKLNDSILTNSITGPIIINYNNLPQLPVDYTIVYSINPNEIDNLNKINKCAYIVGPKISLINKNLTNIDFSNINLSNANLILSDLTGSILTNTNLSNTLLPFLIGPLSYQTESPINYNKTISFVNLDNNNWLINNLNEYKWDYFLSQLYNDKLI